MGIALFDFSPEDERQTNEAVGSLNGFVSLCSGLSDVIDDGIEMGLIGDARYFDLYLADERHIDAVGIAAQRTIVFVSHMAVLARHLSEELLLEWRVKQIWVEGMAFTIIDEAVIPEKRIGAEIVATGIGI